jgi:hypothetical protein
MDGARWLAGRLRCRLTAWLHGRLASWRKAVSMGCRGLHGRLRSTARLAAWTAGSLVNRKELGCKTDQQAAWTASARLAGRKAIELGCDEG